MKRTIYILLVLAFSCFQLKAQVALADMDSLYRFWEKYRMQYNVDMIYQNIPDVGLLRQYKFEINWYEIRDYSMMNARGIKIINDRRDMEYEERKHVVDMQTIATVEALMDKAEECDKWESRVGNVDTMMYSLVFTSADAPIPLNDKHNTMVDAAEYLTFTHHATKKGENSYSTLSQGFMFYSCLLDSIRQNSLHFDIAELLELLNPILVQPDIECRSIYLSHSSDMWRHAAHMIYVDLDEEPCGKGETNGFVFTMQDDKQADEVLSKIKEVIQVYTATHFDLPYIYIPNRKWGGQAERLFYATNSRFPQFDENTLKLDIMMGDWGMEHNLLVAVTQGDRLLPVNWLQYSRIVDGNEVRVR